ncbi:MAG: hypothetical protein Q9193_000166 [Seirophora villosa]
MNLQNTETRPMNSHPIHHHFSKSPPKVITRSDGVGSERMPAAATTSRNNKYRKTQTTCLTTDTHSECSVAAHLAGQTTRTPPTTPRNNKRKHKYDNTQSDNSSFKRRKWNPVHPKSASSKPATVDLTTPRSSERFTSASDRSPRRSHGGRRRSTNSPWRNSNPAKSTPKSGRRRGSHGRQAVSAFEAVHIPKSSICKRAAGAERINPNGVQGQVRRRQPPRQAKPWPSVEVPLNQVDGEDTPYPWDEPVVYDTNHIRQWEIDNVLNGFEPRASPARERDETFDPDSSMPASDVDTTPFNHRRRSTRMGQNDDGQPESSAAAERRRYRTRSSNSCSSTATRFKREVTAAIDYVSTHIVDLTGNDNESLPTSERESHIHRIGILTRQLAQMKAWLQEEPELAAANRMECEALLASADALVRKLHSAKTAGLQSLSENGKHLKPPARIVAATPTKSNGTTADDACSNSEVPAAQASVVKRREIKRDQETCERVIRARSAPSCGPLGGIHYRGEFSIPSDPPFLQPTRNRDIASKAVPYRASGHPKRQPQQAHSNSPKSSKEEARVNTAETVIVHAVGRGPIPGYNVTNATRAVDTEDQNGNSTTSKEHGTVCKRDKGKGRADEYAHVVNATDSGLGHQARQGVEVGAHQSIQKMDERAVRDATDAAMESSPDLPDLSTIFRRHNLSRNNPAMTGSTQPQPHHKASDTPNKTVILSNSQVEGDKPVGDSNEQKPPTTALPRHYRFPVTPEREQPSSKGSCHPSLTKTQSRLPQTNVPRTRLSNRGSGDPTLNEQERSTASTSHSRGCDAIPRCAMTAGNRPILTFPNNIGLPPWRKTLGPIAPHVFYQKDAPRAESRQPRTPVSAGLAHRDDRLTATDTAANVNPSVEAGPSPKPNISMAPKFKGIRGMSYYFPAAAARQEHGLPTPICSSSPLRAEIDVSRATDRPVHSHSSATVPSDFSPGDGVRVPAKGKGGQQAPPVTPAKSSGKPNSKRSRDPSPPATPITSSKRTKSKQAIADPCGEQKLSLRPSRQMSTSSSSVLAESTRPGDTHHEDRQPPSFADNGGNHNNDGDGPFITSLQGQRAPLQDIRGPSGDSVLAVQQDVLPYRSKNTVASAGKATSSSRSEERPSKGKSKKVEKQRPAATDTTHPEVPLPRPRQVTSSSQDGLPSNSTSHAVQRSKPSPAPTTTAALSAEASNRPGTTAPPDRARRLPTPATAAHRGVAPMYDNPLLKAFKQARHPLTQLGQPRRTVPHQERASDAELIRICHYASPRVRRLSAPYAFGEKGKLYVDYHYLVHVKGPGWNDAMKIRLTGKEKADWPPERL